MELQDDCILLPQTDGHECYNKYIEFLISKLKKIKYQNIENLYEEGTLKCCNQQEKSTLTAGFIRNYDKFNKNNYIYNIDFSNYNSPRKIKDDDDINLDSILLYRYSKYIAINEIEKKYSGKNANEYNELSQFFEENYFDKYTEFLKKSFYLNQKFEPGEPKEIIHIPLKFLILGGQEQIHILISNFATLFEVKLFFSLSFKIFIKNRKISTYLKILI